MVYELIGVIYTALSSCFQMADKIFSAVGIALVSAICMMVLVSTVLRLFTSRFVGQQINQYQDRVEKAEQKRVKVQAKRDQEVAKRMKIQSGKEIPK